MEQVTATFDRVFDVQRQVRDIFGSKFTTFGFELQGERFFDLSVPGWPSLHDGITVTALLRETGNWKTLIGWVEHGSGEVVRRHAWQYFLWAARSLIVAAVAALLFPLSPKGGDAILPLWAAYSVCAFLAGLGIQDIVNAWRSLQERRMLEKIAESVQLTMSLSRQTRQSTPPQTAGHPQTTRQNPPQIPPHQP